MIMLYTIHPNIKDPLNEIMVMVDVRDETTFFFFGPCHWAVVFHERMMGFWKG